MAGIFGPDQGADGLLGLLIGLGHRIESAAQLVRHVAKLTESRQRLFCGGTRDTPQKLDRNKQNPSPTVAQTQHFCAFAAFCTCQ